MGFAKATVPEPVQEQSQWLAERMAGTTRVGGLSEAGVFGVFSVFGALIINN